MNYIKFSYIVFCFALSFCYKKYHSERDVYLLRTALFFTCVSDFFMVVKGMNLTGLATFILVQILYNFRYWQEKYRPAYVLISLSAAILLGILLKPGILIFGGGVYAIFSLQSLIGVYFWSRQNPSKSGVFAFCGMILFAICDIFVAFYSLTPAYRETAHFLIWLNYVPSQLLLSLSGFNRSKNTAYAI